MVVPPQVYRAWSEAGYTAEIFCGDCLGAPWAFENNLGQRPSPQGRGAKGVPVDARLGTGLGEPPFSRGQALPGYSPDYNADEAV